MFQVRGRISGNSLTVPCASVHPEGQLKQKEAVTETERRETEASFWSGASKGRQNDARQRTSDGWWRVAFRMVGCAVFLKPSLVTSGLFSLLSKVSISAAMFCHPKKEALQYSLISNSSCEMHGKIGGSGCWICSTFLCTVTCCHNPPVSWGRVGLCGKTGAPSARSHPDPSFPPSLSTYCQIWGNDDFPLHLGEGYISLQAARESWLELQEEGRRGQMCGALWGEADTYTEAEEFKIIL